MEVYFENIYTDTEDYFQQLFAHTYRKFKRKWLLIYSACAAVFLLLWLKDGNIIYSAGIIVYIAFAIKYYRKPSKFAKKRFENKFHYYDSHLPQTTIRFGEHIEISDMDSFQSIPYNKIRSFVFLDEIIYFETMLGHVYLMPKKGFTKGNWENFRQFIDEKYPR